MLATLSWGMVSPPSPLVLAPARLTMASFVLSLTGNVVSLALPFCPFCVWPLVIPCVALYGSAPAQLSNSWISSQLSSRLRVAKACQGEISMRRRWTKWKFGLIEDRVQHSRQNESFPIC